MRKQDIHVGDRLRIRQWDDMADEYGLNDWGEIKCKLVFVDPMRDLCGIEFTVDEISDDGEVVDADPDSPLHNWRISADMCEPVETCDDEFDVSALTTDGLFDFLKGFGRYA